MRFAWALAQFVKRADRDTARRHAGDAQEADLIFDAWIALRSALAEGASPRAERVSKLRLASSRRRPS